MQRLRWTLSIHFRESHTGSRPGTGGRSAASALGKVTGPNTRREPIGGPEFHGAGLSSISSDWFT
jgi:hypothetical protein